MGEQKNVLFLPVFEPPERPARTKLLNRIHYPALAQYIYIGGSHTHTTHAHTHTGKVLPVAWHKGTQEQ